MIPLATYTGRVVDVENLRMEDIDIVDIAHSLALENRFGGHTTKPYPVAQHSVYASYLVSPEYALDALLHDSPEAFGLRDLASPVKAKLRDYRVLHRRVWERVARRFDLHRELPAEVHEVDLRLLLTEARDLCPIGIELFVELSFPDVEARAALPEPFEGEVMPVHWELAKDVFLARFAELTGARRDPTVPRLRLVTEKRVR